MDAIRTAFNSLFAEKDRRPIYEWARDNITELPPVLSLQGSFGVERSRHFVSIFDALQDDYVRQVAICKPVRGGGTLISDIWHCWTRANDPGPMMAVLQSDEIADDHAKTRLLWMMRKCAAIAPYLPDNRHDNTTGEIFFRDGIPVYVNGPGINNLQTKPIRYMSLDEPWLYKQGTIAEAEARLGDFVRLETSKLLLISQAGVEGDDFDQRWQQGDQAVWEVQCGGCGKYFEPRWTWERKDSTKAGMRWDTHKNDDGSWDIGKCLDSIRYECPHCAHPHVNSTRQMSAWNLSGRYTPQNLIATRKRRSFRWNAVIDYPWVELVELYLNAINTYKHGSPTMLIQFFQKRMCEAKSEKTIQGMMVEFKRTQFESADKWEAEHIRFMTVDRQEEDVYWVVIRAWSLSGESRRLYFAKKYGEADLVEVARQFNVDNVFMDSGFRPKGDKGVYAICVRNNWVALKGMDGRNEFWHTQKHGPRVQRSYSEQRQGDPESGQAGEGQRMCPLVLFSAPVMADRLQQLIHRGLWVEPIEDPQDVLAKEYRTQMSAEFKKPKVNKFTGRTEFVWVCPSGNNHAWDCSKMQVAVASIAEIIPDSDVMAQGHQVAGESPSTNPEVVGAGAA